MDQLSQIIRTPVVLFPVFLDMGAVLSRFLTLQVIWVLLVPLLLKLIARDLAVSVHSIAARRAVKDFAATLGPSMVATARFLMKANSSRGTLLLIWRRGRCLHVSGVSEHGNLDTNLRNSLVIFVIV